MPPFNTSWFDELGKAMAAQGVRRDDDFMDQLEMERRNRQPLPPLQLPANPTAPPGQYLNVWNPGTASTIPGPFIPHAVAGSTVRPRQGPLFTELPNLDPEAIRPAPTAFPQRLGGNSYLLDVNAPRAQADMSGAPLGPISGRGRTAQEAFADHERQLRERGMAPPPRSLSAGQNLGQQEVLPPIVASMLRDMPTEPPQFMRINNQLAAIPGTYPITPPPMPRIPDGTDPLVSALMRSAYEAFSGQPRYHLDQTGQPIRTSGINPAALDAFTQMMGQRTQQNVAGIVHDTSRQNANNYATFATEMRLTHPQMPPQNILQEWMRLGNPHPNPGVARTLPPVAQGGLGIDPQGVGQQGPLPQGQNPFADLLMNRAYPRGEFAMGANRTRIPNARVAIGDFLQSLPEEAFTDRGNLAETLSFIQGRYSDQGARGNPTFNEWWARPSAMYERTNTPEDRIRFRLAQAIRGLAPESVGYENPATNPWNYMGPAIGAAWARNFGAQPPQGSQILRPINIAELVARLRAPTPAGR